MIDSIMQTGYAAFQKKFEGSHGRQTLNRRSQKK
jgi:hypothetical protein